MTTEVTIFCDATPDHPGFKIEKELAETLVLSDGDRLDAEWYRQTLAAYRGYNCGVSVQFRRSLAATLK